MNKSSLKILTVFGRLTLKFVLYVDRVICLLSFDSADRATIPEGFDDLPKASLISAEKVVCIILASSAKMSLDSNSIKGNLFSRDDFLYSFNPLSNLYLWYVINFVGSVFIK